MVKSCSNIPGARATAVFRGGTVQEPCLAILTWQPNAKGGSLVHTALEFNPAAMFAHNPLHDHETEAGPLFFRGVEWFKNAVNLVFGDAPAGIRDPEPNCFGRRFGLEGQYAPPSHCLNRVFHQVYKHLFDLARIDWRCRKLPLELFLNADPAVLDFGPEKIHRFPDHVIQIAWGQPGGCRAEGLKKLGDDIIQPCDFSFSDTEILLHLEQAVLIGFDRDRITFAFRFPGVDGGSDDVPVARDFFELPFHQLEVNVKSIE